jgi:hypothetical protein
MACISLSRIIFPIIIVVILSGKPNTMVSGARNLLEPNIPQLPKLDFPPLAKHGLLKIYELPKSEIPRIPGLSKSEFRKVPELFVPVIPKVPQLPKQELLKVSKYLKHELIEIPGVPGTPQINQLPKYEVVIQPDPVAVTIPGPILGNRP